MIQGGGAIGGFFFGKERLFNKKWWKNSLFSKLWKIKSLFTKLGEKWGYTGEKICLFLCLRREKKGLFLVTSKKNSLHTGKTIVPPTHVSSGPPLTDCCDLDFWRQVLLGGGSGVGGGASTPFTHHAGKWETVFLPLPRSLVVHFTKQNISDFGCLKSCPFPN